MTLLATGLLLGIAGSLHCAGMCGPLVIAIRHGTRAPGTGVRGRFVLYHLGRIGAYAALGALAGAAGSAITAGGLGRWLSVGAGAVLLAFGVADLARLGRFVPARATVLLARGLAFARRQDVRHPHAAPVLAGVMNAMLPCGMLYGALVAAAALADSLAASAFLAAYGIGTTPALWGAWMAAGPSLPQSRARFRLASTVILVVAGLLLIGRGVAPPIAHGDEIKRHVH
jgi:sulfite exporter TauE/SafE